MAEYPHAGMTASMNQNLQNLGENKTEAMETNCYLGGRGFQVISYQYSEFLYFPGFET